MPAASVVSGATYTTKRKVDDRIKILIDDAVAQKHRSVVMLVGDRCKDQIVNLHTMVSRAQHSAKVNVLWCMKDEPLFSSTAKHRLQKQGKAEVRSGMATEASKETFETFLQQTDIRYCQYKESHKVLGRTFGMAILQDFEAMTPNILARTVETVAGGGMVLILVRAMRSLKQLYTIAMDVHSRFRSDAHDTVVPRFNERFLLSLCDCRNFICVDDDLNVLPITSSIKNMAARRARRAEDDRLRLEGRLRHEAELADLKAKLSANKDVGPLVQTCSTIDQAKTVLSLARVIAEKSLKMTAAITAGRGRGKSAALGLSIACAVAQGYSNIFVTAPSPENVATLFEFAMKGLTDLGYVERTDFHAMQSTNVDFAKCIVRIDVTRDHRQTVQFIAAQDVDKFAQAELLVIDEAAAIPLPLVQRLMGPYLLFMSSTVSGYEGTGRSLSMKLIGDMKKRCAAGTETRALTEVQLEAPIRYGPNDPVEQWLTKLLCLDATTSVTKPKSTPHPSSCELYYVNRDALFSYHPTAETTLQQLVSLFVAAHYKNQPNDLQLLSDAPGHHLFALCGPRPADGSLPDIFCVVHVAEEGNIKAERLATSLQSASRPSGDLIPFTIAQHYMEQGFAKLGGIRVVRIATHPDLQRAGYGSHALNMLLEYYGGGIAAVRDFRDDAAPAAGDSNANDTDGVVAPRSKIPSLLIPLDERPNEAVDYVGVSFGLTTQLFGFWQRAGFRTLYLRQVPNELTGEHSCIMVRTFGLSLATLHNEFLRRFLALLPMSFRNLPVDLALSVALDGVETTDRPGALADAPATGSTEALEAPATAQQLAAIFSEGDLRRLSLFSTTYVDTSVVLDLVPRVAKVYFERRLARSPTGGEGVTLTHGQAAVLLAMGLQCRHVDDLAAAPTGVFASVTAQQLRAFFQKGMARIVEHFRLVLDAADAPAPGTTAEEQQEIRDKQGNVIGLSVKRTEVRAKETDSTLYRDAKAVGNATTRDAPQAPKSRKFRRTAK
eukprot:CAMPEP_0174832144 /NCGR_PEP_ID=MMETSP1114-20130205/3509_1 /TAXON_ID=312471 /ORGANISM="Neobodo designis, Strain CCAP 1951/1" /LENGTH=1002 /DNA_ID=CAMNT_0016065999 /DNA_START=43 /DNA_END=3051 /DNA_ORIENTATION=-